MGLVSAASGCPHMAPFRPMGRFHLPMAEMSETFYRVASMYLMAQLMRKNAGLDAELSLDGLKLLYANVHDVNISLAERLRDAAREDASVNALILLDAFAQNLPLSFETRLEDFEPLFKAYLEP